MFIGHYGASFIAATQPKSPRLGTLFIAAQLIDFGFFGFVILGIEHLRLVPGTTVMNPMDLYDMPWTHSLAGALVWSAAFAMLIWIATRNLTGAMIGGTVVASHWALDLLVHTRDLTLAGGGQKYGLGLWNMPLIEIPLELLFAFGGLAWYLRHSRATGAAGRWSPIVLAVALAGLQAFNWFGQPVDQVIDPPPATLAPLGLFAYSLLAGLAWWMARNREPKRI